jgi:hypothetical protein
MMDGICLQDKISRGMGLAARKLGTPFVVYRPACAANPLISRNRIIKLNASFNAEDGRFRTVSGFGRPVWWGVFDASYTQPGDYLVGTSGTYFICAQRPLLPVQCVATNRVVQILRAAVPVTGGYSGFSATSAVPVLTGFPASLLEAGTRAGDTDVRAQKLGGWNLLLPALPVSPQAGDVVIDDSSQNYVVGAAEQSALGWRLQVRQTAA